MYQITSYKFVMVILLKALVRWLCYLIGIWRWWTKNIEYKRSFSLKGIKKRKKMIRIFFHFLNYVELAAFVLKIKKESNFGITNIIKKKMKKRRKVSQENFVHASADNLSFNIKFHAFFLLWLCSLSRIIRKQKANKKHKKAQY